MNSLAGALCGAAVGLGLLLLAIAITGPPTRTAGARTRPQWTSDRLVLRLSLAFAGAIVVALATGWPAGALIAGIGGWASPTLVGSKARRAAAVAKIEAIAGWAEQLRDVMAAADGIQSAIQATAPLAPAPIRPAVRRLADRLAQRDRLAPALRDFADDVDHPLADMVVTSLLIAAERQGRLGDLLGEVASAARRTASMRLRVEAVRSRTYVTTRLIIGVTIAMTVWLIVGRREYLAPFDTAGGQVMLVIIGAVFFVSGVLMQRMAQPDEPARLLARTGAR